VTIHKMPNLLDTYNTYIKYIEKASFYRHKMRSSALVVVEISECDDKDAVTHQKVATHLIILDVVVMKVNTRLTCFTEVIGIEHPLTHYKPQVSLCHSCRLLQSLLSLCCLGRHLSLLWLSLATYILHRLWQGSRGPRLIICRDGVLRV
jgi:hypothetical protein